MVAKNDPALAERAAIVAWLRGLDATDRNWTLAATALVTMWVASSIERGDHDYPDIQRLQLGKQED